MASPKVCAVDGCGKPAWARGWCNPHYSRWRRHGEPTAGGVKPGSAKQFTDEELRERRRAKDRARYWADPDKARAKNAAYYAANVERESLRKKAFRQERREEWLAQKRGYREVNKERLTEQDRAWRIANPDRVAAAAIRFAKTEKCLEYRKSWREKNIDRERARLASWVRNNPDKARAKVARRRAAKLRATPKWADHDAIAAVYAEAVRLTRETGVPHEVDHFYPLKGKLVCGLHIAANLRVVTRRKNRSKGNRLTDEHPGLADQHRALC